MTRAPTRTHFHSAKLIRVLADLAVMEAAAPQAFAEKLGLWVDFTDAIKLCAVHNAPSESPAAPPSPDTPSPASVGVAYARAKDRLKLAVTHSFLPSAGRSRLKLPPPGWDEATDLATAYAPYRRFHAAQQQDMALGVRTLRTQVRDILAQTSPNLRQLSALDAAFDQILTERENKLLASVPALLEKRFGHWLHQQAQHVQQAQQGAATWWPSFCLELQTVLLAELDLRLQPTLGLIEALQDQTTHTL